MFTNILQTVYYFGLWNSMYITPHFIETPCQIDSIIYKNKPSTHMYTISKYYQNGKHPYTIKYNVWEIHPGFDASNVPVWIIDNDIKNAIYDKNELIPKLNTLLYNL